MKALKRNKENLEKVINHICSINFNAGSFYLEYSNNESATLLSKERNRIGKTIISLIPTNWEYAVTFEDNCLKLFIWTNK